MVQMREIFVLLSTFIGIGGGAWLAWGIISLGFAINDHNGGGIRSGILQIVGGGMVLAGGVYLGTL